MINNIRLSDLQDTYVTISWDKSSTVGVDSYHVYWADRADSNVTFKLLEATNDNQYTLNKASHVPHYFIVAEVKDGEEISKSDVFATPVKKVFNEQLEVLSRGLIAVKTKTGIFLSWRLMLDEVDGYSDTGMTGTDFVIYKNDMKIEVVTNSTNYLDEKGQTTDNYYVAPIKNGVEGDKSSCTKAWESGENYIEIPIVAPEDGVTPIGDTYTYNANDMSVADVDGDGEYEYILKWDPANSQDVSIKGYTGKCFIDCYRLDGTILWRLDMGVNIRAGAHYTQFMVYDFDGDGKAEMSVKSAPGTKMIRYDKEGNVMSETYITLPESDIKDGITHEDNYVCSAQDYREHLIAMFMNWHEHEQVLSGQWPKTLEACFGIDNRYEYPLNRVDAEALVMYFIDDYAKERSPKNDLSTFEGFIYEGPEYLTMFAGNGEELETIPFKYERVDDGLMWGDYSMKRIEPCNRVDRFLSGVAYLDGENPYLIIARGYYTRATIVAYRFTNNHHEEHFSIDSGFVPMSNPFKDGPHGMKGTDPVYGEIAGQGNHSLATADVDGDGCQEIIYGACVIDHDGSILHSRYDVMPDGSVAKLGHGDALHVAKIDPDRPGLQIFSVFEGGVYAPYGYALRDAETGEVFYGEYATVDLGRCMIGDVNSNVRGLQCWVQEMYDCKGNVIDMPVLGTNQSIKWACDMSTQLIDGVDYIDGKHAGVINDYTHGIMLEPRDVATNNGTKGNPCLIADVFGDFREELLIRRADNKAIRIYTNTDITEHKLFTLMHDIQYRTGVAWQNNCYNQPCYTKFYYASDMDWAYVLPQLKKINKLTY